MKKLSFSQLADLSDQARQSPRMRMNHNIHTDLSDSIQRLAIAMEPETYIRPHRHMQTFEMLTALKGRFIVLIFDDEGVVVDRMVLGETESVIETPVGGWHAVQSLDKDAVIFEVKYGPYMPAKEEDFAPWSPKPEDEQYKDLMAWYHQAQIGDRWTTS